MRSQEITYNKTCTAKLLLAFGIFCAIGIWFFPGSIFQNQYVVMLYTNSSTVSPLNIKFFLTYTGIIIIFLSYRMSRKQRVVEHTGNFVNIKVLNGIRGLSTLAIILFHWQPYRFTTNTESLFKMSNVTGDSLTILNNSLIYIFQFGDLVLGTFVITSGIGLSMKYYSSKSIDKVYWKKFYSKRFTRLIPLYWFVLILAYTHAYYAGEQVTLQGLLGNMFLMGNYHVPWRNELALVNGPLWFVPFIFILYLLFPALVRIREILGSTIFLLAFLVLEILYRITFIWIVPVSRVGEFCIGITIGSILVHEPNKIKNRFQSPLYAFFAIALLIILVDLTNKTISYGLSNSAIELLVFIIIWNISALMVKVEWIYKLFTWIAFSSYAAYLIHVVGIQLVPAQLRHGKNAALMGLLFVSVIFIISYFIARLESGIMDKIHSSK
jgi:peptidoglycan/LPS O-acetylase OafA/YrhL